MTDFTVPTGWKYNGANNGNQSIFILPGHTTAAPRLAIFDRSAPTYVNGGSTVPRYRIRIIRGITDSEGEPVRTRVTCDVTIRWPTMADSSDVMADIAELGSILSDTDMQDDIVVEQLLPR